jgi:hypothetical protein
MLKQPLLRFPSISLPQLSQEIKLLPLFQSVSAQDDSGNCFNKLQLRWKTLCAHGDTVLHWSLADDSPSCFKDSGIISEWLLLLLVELNIPTPSGVKWTGHSLRRSDASTEHALGAISAVIMDWGL